MFFDFDIRKTISAVAFLMKREGGRLDMFLTLKMLYLADKEALVKWGKPITGDSFVSMDKGPVLSRTYNLFKGKDSEYQAQWNAAFTERLDNSIYPNGAVDLELLSEREMEALETARIQINSLAPGAVADWLHRICPEWQDPQGSSIPIDPDTILRKAGKTENELRIMDASNEAFRYAKALINNG